MLNRFGEFFGDVTSIDVIPGDELTRFAVALTRDHKRGPNTVRHNAERSTSHPKDHRQEHRQIPPRAKNHCAI